MQGIAYCVWVVLCRNCCGLSSRYHRIFGIVCSRAEITCWCCWSLAEEWCQPKPV